MALNKLFLWRITNIYFLIFRYESKQKELHPVYREAVPIEPLSSPSCQLLKEFSLRYGVGILLCKLSYLEYIVK